MRLREPHAGCRPRRRPPAPTPGATGRRGQSRETRPAAEGSRRQPKPTGEIQAKGPNVFAGYWHNPEATREAFTGDGFFRTGDLGRLDAEGYLHIVGRSKELIVLAGGKNIFPEEVEAVYADSPTIHELAVLDQGGRLVGLIVPEIAALQAEDADALRQRLRTELEERSRRLASYQRLSDFAITAEPLPRTQIGKLRRHELGPLFERAKAGAGAPATPKELSARDRALLDSAELGEVWHWLEERFAPKPLSLDSSPQLDLGLDSFDWMSLTMELGERFGAQLSEDAVARVTTLRDLLVEVERATGSAGAAVEIRELSPEQERWLQPQGWPLRALGAVLFALNRLIMRGLFRLRVEGREHLPAEGPCLLAPNHASYLDPFAIAAALVLVPAPRALLGRLDRPPVPRPAHPPLQPRRPGPAGRSRARPDLDPAARPCRPRARLGPGLVPRRRPLDRWPDASLPARRRPPDRARRRAGGAGLDRRHLRRLAAGARLASPQADPGPLRPAAHLRARPLGAERRAPSPDRRPPARRGRRAGRRRRPGRCAPAARGLDDARPPPT